MSARWLAFWLIFVAGAWLLAAVLMVLAVLDADYARATFDLGLVAVNSVSFVIIARGADR